jgi:hypothetical protein
MYLQRLRLDTEAKLREATDEDARRILNKFIASFGDGHLEIEWPKGSAQPNPYETALSLASSGLASSANTPIPRFVNRWYAICA